MKKTIKDYILTGKKVIIRCDFNVPTKGNKITDDNRIIESLNTIKYAISDGAKVILMSHLGRVEVEADKLNNSLKPVADRLTVLLGKKVLFVPFTRGIELETAINSLGSGDVLLMENTRFEDIPNKAESKNDPELGAYWASLGNIYINDAFGTSHRAHASNVGIASHLPNGVGFLIEKELKVLEPAINNPTRPLTVILGGSKVADKIGVISNLVNIADHILIGGGMAYTFLKAMGNEVGTSLLDNTNLDFCKDMMNKYPDKIILPIDVICAHEIKEDAVTKECLVTEIPADEMGLDIGPKTIILFNSYIQMSKTVIWNGPLGVFELNIFANGTKGISQILADLHATTIIGGGDTASAVINFGYKDKMTHVSTGGGASLELLEGKKLPGIEVISNI